MTLINSTSGGSTSTSPPNTPRAASHSLSPAIPASADSFAHDMLNN